MSTFRTSHSRSNPYVMINKGFLEDPSLSAKAKGILAYLLSRPDNWQTRTEQLIAVMREGREAIMSGLRELEKNGYFERTPARDSVTGRITSWVKNVYENPVLKPSSPTSGFSVDGEEPHPGSPQTGFASEGKPYSGLPDPIVNIDITTNDSIKKESVINECDQGEKSEISHTENSIELLEPEEELATPDPSEQPKEINHGAEAINHGLEPNVPARDNKAKRQKFLIKIDRLDELEDAFNSGEDLGTLRVVEQSALCDRVMGDRIALYRHQGKILNCRPNDIKAEFLVFVAARYWNSPKEIKKASDMIRSYERDLSKWQTLYICVDEWKESLRIADPNIQPIVEDCLSDSQRQESRRLQELAEATKRSDDGNHQVKSVLSSHSAESGDVGPHSPEGTKQVPEIAKQMLAQVIAALAEKQSMKKPSY